ncbi:hypothetical protein TRIP_C20623 [Candidatus Zixiibacteriota bacterium]|nr:hypothetical protein TRIP_C20623 [candidate division Zixibacteria bacterium]
MDPKVRKLIVFCVFIAAIIYGTANLIGTSAPPPAPVPEPAHHEAKPSLAAKSTFIDIEKYRSLAWGSDPFSRENNRLAIVTTPTAPERPVWTLGGILYDETHPAAIVNGRIVRKGESVNGAVVSHIGRNQVILQKDGEEISLSIAKDKS